MTAKRTDGQGFVASPSLPRADASPNPMVSAWTRGHCAPLPGQLVGGIIELEPGGEGMFTTT